MMKNRLEQIREWNDGGDLPIYLYNVVKYAVEHNNCKTNWTAREIFTDIVSEELLQQHFDEE